MLSFNNKIHNCIKDAELERKAAMKQRASICLGSKFSKKSVSRRSSSSSSSKRSSKSDMALMIIGKSTEYSVISLNIHWFLCYE